MLPLVLVAFGGIGLTRLTLLALELHDDEEAARRQLQLQQQQQEQHQEEESEEEREAAKARVLWEMARREKPVKLIMRNGCQFACVWADDDSLLHKPDLSVENLLRANVQRQQQQQEVPAAAWGQEEEEEEEEGDGGVGIGGFLRRAEADMTAFVEQLGGELLKPPASSSNRSGRVATTPPSPSDMLQEEPAVALLREGMRQRRKDRARLLQQQEQQQPSSSVSSDQCSCVVCYEAPRDAVFLPCGHSATCLDCALDVYRKASGSCPLCRTNIAQIVTLGPKEVLKGSGLLVAEVAGPTLLPL